MAARAGWAPIVIRSGIPMAVRMTVATNILRNRLRKIRQFVIAMPRLIGYAVSGSP